jgi:hypothetical protein
MNHTMGKPQENDEFNSSINKKNLKEGILISFLAKHYSLLV